MDARLGTGVCGATVVVTIADQIVLRNADPSASIAIRSVGDWAAAPITIGPRESSPWHAGSVVEVAMTDDMTGMFAVKHVNFFFFSFFFFFFWDSILISNPPFFLSFLSHLCIYDRLVALL